MITIDNLRDQFFELKKNEDYVIDKTGVKMLEIIGESFIADEPAIFGVPNYDYIEREIDWYLSQSRYVRDIPGKTPAIWEQVSDENGMINSNYGWCIFSEENGFQYDFVLDELKESPFSRRAIMIYNRPTMHTEYSANGMNDFICTNCVQYMIRDDKLYAVVSMRSNDAWAGYRNDFAWQDSVMINLEEDLGIERGGIIWNAGSLHFYQKDFYLIDHFGKTGELSIKKSEYRKLYPDSEWC